MSLLTARATAIISSLGICVWPTHSSKKRPRADSLLRITENISKSIRRNSKFKSTTGQTAKEHRGAASTEWGVGFATAAVILAARLAGIKGGATRWRARWFFLGFE